MFIPKINLTLTGHPVVDEKWSDVGAGVLLLGHDAFFGNADMEIYTGPGKTGTKLTETTDYVLLNEDADLTAKAGQTVYTAIQIVNATYQSGALYFTYKAVADYAAIDDINAIKCLTGAKVGMEIYHAGPNDLRITPGFLHVNNGRDHYLQTDTETLLTGEAGWWGWKYVTINHAGAVNVRNATGEGYERPTDSFFQWSGYIHDKGGYYYNANERIIGAVYRVSAGEWYIINCGEGGEESGENSLGYWHRTKDGKQECWGRRTESLSATTSYGTLYRSASVLVTWPVAFTVEPTYSFDTTMLPDFITMTATLTTSIDIKIGANVYVIKSASDSTPRTTYIGFHATGRWK